MVIPDHFDTSPPALQPTCPPFDPSPLQPACPPFDPSPLQPACPPFDRAAKEGVGGKGEG